MCSCVPVYALFTQLCSAGCCVCSITNILATGKVQSALWWTNYATSKKHSLTLFLYFFIFIYQLLWMLIQSVGQTDMISNIVLLINLWGWTTCVVDAPIHLLALMWRKWENTATFSNFSLRVPGHFNPLKLNPSKNCQKIRIFRGGAKMFINP